jgi:serine phosphatase RsbU (regulator of sigma subunit)
VTSLAGSNLPVGLFAGVGYDSATLELRGGDAVLLFTDGVTEAEDASGEFFGDQRLTQLVQEACPSADESLIDCIIGAVDRFRGRVALRDDCTAVELKFAGQAKFGPVAV